MSLEVQQNELFSLAERKLSWLDQRQRVLSQNIANADTPGYRSRDLVEFHSVLDSFDITPTRTSSMHLSAFSSASAEKATSQVERAPDGNAVSVEAELTKVADDETSQALVGNIWRTYMGMFMTALGHGG